MSPLTSIISNWCFGCRKWNLRIGKQKVEQLENMDHETDILEIFPDGLILTPLFWDCECESNYIHPKSQISCEICVTESSDQPDSRAIEVLDQCPNLLSDRQRKAFANAIRCCA